MGKRQLFRTLLGLLMIGGVSVAARGEGPATTQATVWFKKAQGEIATLPEETPNDFFVLQPFVLGSQLYLMAPTDERRALACGQIDKMVKREVDKKKSAEWTRSAYIGGAWCHACIGDLAGARQFMALADQSTGLAPSTAPTAGSTMPMTEEIQGVTFILMGDKAAFEKMKLTRLDFTVGIDELVMMGHIEDARWVAELERKQVWGEIAPVGKPLFREERSEDRVGVISDLAHCGELTEAREAAEIVEAGLMDEEKLEPGFFSFKAYFEIAKAALDAGDVDGYRLARTSAIDVCMKYPKETSFDIQQLMRLCVRARDREGFNSAANHFKARMSRSQQDGGPDRLFDIEPLAQAAGFYAAMGDQAAYRAAVEEMERILSEPYQGGAMTDEEKKERLKNLAMKYLWVAAARARAGDVAGVKNATEASKRTATLEASDWDEEWWSVCAGYADAGLLDQAEMAADDLRWDSYGTELSYIARREAESGRFDEAWKLAGRVPAMRRADIEYFIAVRQVQAGQEGKMGERVEALKTPYEKALVELAVGEALLGKTFEGNFRQFLPKND